MALSKIQLTENIGRKNLVINGAMQVAQRGQATGVAIGYGGADRFQFASSGATRVALSQGTMGANVGSGFRNSQRVNCTTEETSLAAGDYAMIRTKIEGQDLQHLLYGTSSAKKLTLQFWVRSPKTGIHVAELYHGDANYYNSRQYTIAAADTWQKVTLTFDGYQTTALDNDNGIGIQIAWWLAAGDTYSSGTHTDNSWHNTPANRAVGQVNCMDDTSNNFYFTGVQLEVGETATDFEHRSVGEELTLCQRYYQLFSSGGAGTATASSQSASAQSAVQFATQMRDIPNITVGATSATSNTSSVSVASITAHGCRCSASASATGRQYWFVQTNIAEKEL